MKLLPRLLFLLLASFPVLAHAHPGHDGHDFGWDFRHGLTHPLTGWDHLLALLAVGVWATTLPAVRRWQPLAFFSTALALGLASGAFLPAGLWIEAGIALSLIGFGLFLVAPVTSTPTLRLALTGVFALCHGAAHASELSAHASAVPYFSGLFLGSVAVITLCTVLAPRLGLARHHQLVGSSVFAAGVCAVIF